MGAVKMISVIIPVYNAEAYLRDCLDSVVNQTYRNLEIILVDDGSSDKSLEICREYAETDDRIILISQKNAGEAAARNRGIEAALGEFIMFVDADDLIAYDICESAVDAVQNADVLIFDYAQGKEPEIFASTKIDAVPVVDLGNRKNDEWVRSLLGFRKDLLVQASLNTAWGKLYRRGFLEAHRILCDKGIVIGADMIFNLKVFLKEPVVRYLPARGYFYRYNPASVVHRYNPEIRRSYGLLHDAIARGLEVQNCQEKFLVEMGYQKIYGLLQIFSRNIFHPDNPNSESKKKADFLELVRNEEYQQLLVVQKYHFSFAKRMVLSLAKRKQYLLLKWLYLAKQHLCVMLGK